MVAFTQWYPEKIAQAAWQEGDVGDLGLYQPTSLPGPCLHLVVRSTDGGVLRLFFDPAETQEIQEYLWREHHTCPSPQ